LREVGHERQRLALSEQRLTMQIETFRAREEMVAARYSAAEAQVKLGESLAGITHEMFDLDQTLQATQRKTDQMQARAAALDELVDGGLLTDAGRPPADALERELAALDAAATVEAQLAALKDDLANLPGGAALEAEQAVETQLATLKQAVARSADSSPR